MAIIGISILFKLVGAAAINDAGYEATVATLKKIEEKDPTGLSSKLLRFLASDQNLPQGITLKDSVQADDVKQKLQRSDINITILTADEIVNKLPDIDAEKYDLIISGKPRDVIKANNLIMADIQTIEALSKDEPMNTVFGRLYEVARNKLPSLKL